MLAVRCDGVLDVVMLVVLEMVQQIGAVAQFKLITDVASCFGLTTERKPMLPTKKFLDEEILTGGDKENYLCSLIFLELNQEGSRNCFFPGASFRRERNPKLNYFERKKINLGTEEITIKEGYSFSIICQEIDASVEVNAIPPHLKIHYFNHLLKYHLVLSVLKADSYFGPVTCCSSRDWLR